MKTIYEASNALEAHMILDLLQQQGFKGRVDGEFLQGGVGELPAAGLVRVMVAEEDYAGAREVVEKWDSAQPSQAETGVQKKTGSRASFFLFGLALGVLCTYVFLRVPATQDGIDHNRDGKIDEKWVYARSGMLVGSEVDRNFDGKLDYISTYGRDGVIESTEFDDDFDGVFESRTTYRLGSPYLSEIDTDGDRYMDFKINFEHGVAISNEYIYPATGYPEKIEYYKLGKLTHAETDTDKDGKMDRRIDFNSVGEISSVADIR